MVERIKESGSILDKKQIINSFLSFKKEFDQKIKNCSTINKDIPKPNENFINIYKANNDENMEKIKINNFSTNQMTNIEIQQKSKPLKISDLDFFNNSELLLSNIDEMINKDNVLNSQTLVKVPTSDSLEDIQNENDQNYEMNESNRSRSFSPNSTAVNFGRSERLKSIDEKDESREEDNVSKSSKKLIEDYHIITEEEYVKKKSNKIIPQKENSIKKNSDKKKCDNNLSDIGDKIFSEKNKGKEKTKEMKLIPKFTFLDYKEFKNKSLHSQNSKIKETNDLKPYIAKTENSLSVNSIPNNSSFYKQKVSNNSSRKNLKLEVFEITQSLNHFKNNQRKTPTANSSEKNVALASSNFKNNDQNKYASLHSPRKELGSLSTPFLINLKIYSGFKNKTEKNKKSTSLNHSKKIDNFNSSDNNIKSQYKNNSFQKKKSHFNNSQIFKLKERTQKDIELIDKEISQELLIQKNEKKQQHKKTKSTMHKAQKKISSEKSYEENNGKDLKKKDKNQRMLKTIGNSQPNLLTKSNKKSMCVSIDNNVSSRKNSRNSYDSKFHSSPTRAHSNNTQKNNYSNKSSDKETKELIPKKVYFKSSFEFSNSSSKNAENKHYKPSSNQKNNLLRQTVKPFTIPQKKRNNNSLNNSANNFKKKSDINSNSKNSSCPKDLWDEIQQIYNLFHEVDTIMVNKGKSTK